MGGFRVNDTVSDRCRDWVDATERKAAAKLERLDNELNGYKSNLIKESIRMGHNDMGDFYYARGDLQVRVPAVGEPRSQVLEPLQIGQPALTTFPTMCVP